MFVRIAFFYKKNLRKRLLYMALAVNKYKKSC